MQITIDLVLFGAAMTAISTGTAVLSARVAAKKQKREDIMVTMHSVILEHQATCQIGEQLRNDARRDRQEMLNLLQDVRKELASGMAQVNRRLDAIFGRMGSGDD